MKKKNTMMRKRHSIFFGIFRPIGRIYCRIRYGFTAKVVKLEKGKSHVVICNHTTFADQFMVGSYFNKALYFLASDDLLNKWTGRYIIWMLGIIPKAKSSKDLTAVRKAKRVVNEGGNVMVFPEGNRTYSGELCHVDIAIAKFVKMLKSDLVIYNLVGGYGVLPRFANKQRKGRMQGLVREIIPASEVAEMSVETLYEKIKAGLSVEKEEFSCKSKVRAENVERAVYICPNCGKMDNITSKGNMIGCKNCDLEVEYLEDLTLKPMRGNFNFPRIADWYKWQRAVAIEMFSKEDNDIVLSDNSINVFQVDNMHLSVLGVFDVKFSEKNGLETFKNGERKLHVPFEDILNMGLMARTKVIIYTKNTIYHLKENGVPTSMMKYMNMFYIIKQRKEGVTNDGNLFLGL
ncbi:MAG: 1-acyl-sn-glycerol-3-phosphate acyltransferase [Bacillota bacterium]